MTNKEFDAFLAMNKYTLAYFVSSYGDIRQARLSWMDRQDFGRDPVFMIIQGWYGDLKNPVRVRRSELFLTTTEARDSIKYGSRPQDS